MERIKLVYKTEVSDEIELPFRILVLGDFTLKASGTLEDNVPALVTLANFDEILSFLDVCLTLELPNWLNDEGEEALKIEMKILDIHGFSPDAVVNAVPEMSELVRLKQLLMEGKQKKQWNEELLDTLNSVFPEFRKELEGGQKDLIDYILAEINHKLTIQLDAILHHPDFQELESSWRSLYYLVKQVVAGENCEVVLLSVNRAQLEEDFNNSGDIQDSYLYKVVYSDELGQFGGAPYSVIIGNYEFGVSLPDLKLLESCGEVARLSFAPFITGANASILGFERFSDISGVQTIEDMFDRGVQYIKWRSFRETEAARYVGLTLPGFLLRKAYDFKTEYIYSFAYVESPYSLWGNAAFAFAVCMLRSFVKYRWHLDIIGKDGGVVSGLDWVKKYSEASGQPLMPIPVMLSEQNEVELTKLGLIPLTFQKGQGTVTFHSANALQAAIVDRDSNQQADLDRRLSVQLPYLFMVCRISHYIKVIQRDNIGTSKTSQELQDELNAWLVQYVSDMENPSPEVRARRPLRRAQVEVAEVENELSLFNMFLKITPHLRYMGASFSLSLQGKL